MILCLMFRGRVKERADVQCSGVGDGELETVHKVWLKDAQRRCNMGDKSAPAVERRRTSSSKHSMAVTRDSEGFIHI